MKEYHAINLEDCRKSITVFREMGYWIAEGGGQIAQGTELHDTCWQLARLVVADVIIREELGLEPSKENLEDWGYSKHILQ